MPRPLLLTVAVLAALAMFGDAYHLCATGGPCVRDSQVLQMPADIIEDFQFEMRNIYTNRQRGARLNILVRFRYYTPSIVSTYTTETGTFDYQDMKPIIMSYVPAGGKNISQNTFWEIVNRDMTKELFKTFPVRGITVRMEVQGMSSGGIPSHRASTVTIGSIDPWPGMINSFPACDGMSTDKGNAACAITPTWTEAQEANATYVKKVAPTAAAKAGKHDKPAKCDTCA